MEEIHTGVFITEEELADIRKPVHPIDNFLGIEKHPLSKAFDIIRGKYKMPGFIDWAYSINIDSREVLITYKGES
jgi:hypothetical protein